MKIEFENHIPDYCDPRGCKREHLYFDSLDELLEAKKEWLIDEEHKDLIFACGNYNTLMVSSLSEEWWWVIGYVKGIDLSKYLPRFDEVYKPKMSKEIDLGPVDGKFDNHYSTKEEWENIQKKLKALEIIKKKRVDVELLMKTQNAKEYNKFSKNVNQSHNLGQREYDFLKEVLE